MLWLTRSVPTMPDAWTSFGESLRSRACLRNQHRDCPHLNGLGGGINRRRLRPEFGAGLCPCTCHASCPVTITGRRVTVPMKTWYDSCTCPGADQARQDVAYALRSIQRAPGFALTAVLTLGLGWQLWHSIVFHHRMVWACVGVVEKRSYGFDRAKTIIRSNAEMRIERRENVLGNGGTESERISTQQNLVDRTSA